MEANFKDIMQLRAVQVSAATQSYLTWHAAAHDIEASAVSSSTELFTASVRATSGAACRTLAHALKEASLATIELDGLRAQRAAEKERQVIPGPTATGAYVGSLQDLMQEGDRYMQLLRSAIREGRTTSRDIASPDKSP